MSPRNIVTTNFCEPTQFISSILETNNNINSPKNNGKEKVLENSLMYLFLNNATNEKVLSTIFMCTKFQSHKIYGFHRYQRFLLFCSVKYINDGVIFLRVESHLFSLSSKTTQIFIVVADVIYGKRRRTKSLELLKVQT